LKDVHWLGLKEGSDFSGCVDLAGLFRVANPKFKSFTVFSQDHLAKVLLGWPVMAEEAEGEGAGAAGGEGGGEAGGAAGAGAGTTTTTTTSGPAPLAHDAALDALKSVRLFNLHRRAFATDPAAWQDAQRRLLEAAPTPSFAVRHPSWEGVCMGNRRTCTCGGPFFS